jgi:hypothetical protein
MSQGSTSFDCADSLLTDRGLQRIVMAMRKLLRLSFCHSRALEMNVS